MGSILVRVKYNTGAIGTVCCVWWECFGGSVCGGVGSGMRGGGVLSACQHHILTLLLLKGPVKT